MSFEYEREIMGFREKVVSGLERKFDLIIEPKSSRMHFEFETHNTSVEKLFGPPGLWKLFSLGENSLPLFRDYFYSAPPTQVGPTNSSGDYFAPAFTADAYKTMNQNQIFRDFTGTQARAAALLEPLKKAITDFTQSSHRIVNIRGWETNSTSTSFGASDWHYDGFPDGHLKIMIYLEGLNSSSGTIEIKDIGPLEGPPGTCLIFQNSGVLHRAVRPASGSSRPVIELTLQRLLKESASIQPIIGSANDQHLRNPWLAYS